MESARPARQSFHRRLARSASSLLIPTPDRSRSSSTDDQLGPAGLVTREGTSGDAHDEILPNAPRHRSDRGPVRVFAFREGPRRGSLYIANGPSNSCSVCFSPKRALARKSRRSPFSNCGTYAIIALLIGLASALPGQRRTNDRRNQDKVLVKPNEEWRSRTTAEADQRRP